MNKSTQDNKYVKIIISKNNYFGSGIRDICFQIVKNQTDLSETWAYRLQSVVDELANNAIEHGTSKSGEIKIIFEYVKEDYIKITVEDYGNENNKIKASDIRAKIKEIQNTDVSKIGIRGRGLAFIVSKWTDKLEIKDKEDGGKIFEVIKEVQNTKVETPNRVLNSNQVII